MADQGQGRYYESPYGTRRRTSRAPSGSFILDGEETILGFDNGMEMITGWEAFQVVGQNNRSSTGVKFYEGAIGVPEESATVLLRFNCADGRSLGVEAMVRRLPGHGDRAVVSLLRILSRSAASPSEWGTDAIDPLCGLMNADAFLQRLEREVRASADTAHPLALVIADVDHLRDVNDRLGRKAGDRVLRGIADTLRVTVVDEDLIGRIGDDDFGILLPGAGRGEARQVAASLRSSVERFAWSDDGLERITVTLSLGAASLPADAENAADLLCRAREALEEARSQGRNRVWCYLRRPRVPLNVPMYLDGAEDLLVGYTRDLSPSGVFVQTAAPIEIGMRCAFAFPLPGRDGNVHFIGRVVRAVPPDIAPDSTAPRIPGMGVEFERFGAAADRHAIELFLHGRESTTLRPERGTLSL